MDSEIAALKFESASKLGGWRTTAAAANVAIVEAELRRTAVPKVEPPPEPVVVADGPASEAAYAALITVRRLLDEHSHNTYLRLRLIGQRLLLATGLLAALLIGLGVAVAADLLGPTQFAEITVLHDFGMYLMIGCLGILGALLSFALGNLRAGTSRRIYELATGRYAATFARVLTGATAAIVVVIAIQAGVVPLNEQWLPMFAIAAGFSERLVRRIVESLSADAEKPRSSAPTTDKPA